MRSCVHCSHLTKELDKDMPIGDCIGVACLPKSADETGKECSITGWGTLMSSGSSAESLKFLSHAKCCVVKMEKGSQMQMQGGIDRNS